MWEAFQEYLLNLGLLHFCGGLRISFEGEGILVILGGFDFGSLIGKVVYGSSFKGTSSIFLPFQENINTFWFTL